MITDKSLHFTWIYAGDGLHLSAVSLLVGWILHRRTCKGISGRTQIIAALVDFLQFAYAVGSNKIYEESPNYYSVIMSGIMSTISAVLLYVIYGRHKTTIEKYYDTFWIELLIILCGGIALVANPVYMDTSDKSNTDPLAVIFYTSIYMDSVSILPQIYFNFRTGSKTLCMSLYVLLSTLSTFFYMYYLVTADLNTTDIEEAYDFNRLEAIPKYTIYPECAQLGLYVMFFILLVVVPKYEKILSLPLSEVESTTGSSTDGEKTEDNEKPDPPVIIVTRPQLDRQQSLLETPFLKKSLPSSASMVSTNPEGTPKLSPFLQSRLLGRQSKPNIAKILRLTHLKRAKTSDSSLFILGAASAPSTPEDEGVMMFKETALQSRQRRQEYNRRRSLPITPTASSTGTSLNTENKNNNNKNLSNDKVKFQIGDPNDSDIKTESALHRKHRKTLSFERFLAAQKLKLKLKQADLAENNKNILNASANPEAKSPNILGKTVDQLDETTDAKIHKSEIPSSGPQPKPDTEPPSKTVKAGPKVSDASRKKSRRSTVYHPGPHSPQTHNNWKMLATNFLGTGPIDVRRPSVYVLPSREEERIYKRRRSRIFSMV